MIDKTYQPSEVEGRISKAWEEAGAFKAGRPERRIAVLPAQPRLSRAAPRESYIGVPVGVDPHGTGLQSRGDAMHARDVGAWQPQIRFAPAADRKQPRDDK